MKILQIAPAWVDTPPENHGGTEWVIANLIKGLSALGHDVVLFATKNSQVEGKVEFIFEKCFLDQNIPWGAALPAFIHYYEAFRYASEYDLVHAHLSSGTDLIILPFLADLTEKHIPNILTIHSRWPFDRYSTTDEMFLDLYADKVLAVNISASMHKTLPKQFQDGGFIHNSLDLTKLKFSPKGGNYLTWLGKIVPAKGVAEAIKIARKAKEQFIFAGVVDPYLEQSVRYFAQKVQPLIDGKQVQYLGPADLKLKNKLLGGAKAFLNPIDWDEPFGMVILESMAAGTPVISYNRGAIPELIKDGETGFLVNNEADMLKMLKKVSKINREACRNHVAKNFSPQVATSKYIKLYFSQIQLHQTVSNDRIIFSGNGADSLVLRHFDSSTSKLNRSSL